MSSQSSVPPAAPSNPPPPFAALNGNIPFPPPPDPTPAAAEPPPGPSRGEGSETEAAPWLPESSPDPRRASPSPNASFIREEKSGSSPSLAAACGSWLTDEPSLTVAEAARELLIPERTLRAWIAEGRVEAFRPDPTRRGMRIRRALLESIRQLAALSGTLPHPAADGGISPAVVEVLQAKLDGAQTAARLLGQRRNEERQRFQAELDREREEREKLSEHLQFLQTQLEGAHEAERELRILMAQSVAAQQQTAHELAELRELKALPPAPPSKVRWWTPWKR
jgi:excisionase family DNA binding protein